ncbi:lactate utilization protein [Miniphocaeibacter massiliensis]|uniref:lactate utilization protein n=1 Tax=Miniphocaeibacter massiliensis TaxID=2041841 RepID=UPI000C1BAE06|nr:lactate utilization protein [Miniphocaeibacter massiliensis]
MNDSIINYKKLQSNFNAKKIKVLFFNTFEQAKQNIIDSIPLNSSIGIGHSQTLIHMNLTNIFLSRGNTVYDKTSGKTKEEVIDLKKKALLSDFYISSANAISEDGHIVNIDHSGNRVAAITFGPEKVFIVVGRNKLRKNLNDAILRAKNIASPKNAKRSGYNPPCVKLNKCINCLSKERVCNSLSIIEGQHNKDRMTLIIVDKDSGF